MTRYAPSLEQQFAATLRQLRERVATLEQRTNPLGTASGGGTYIANLSFHTSSGQTLIYQGDPAPGSLLLSIASGAGVDAFGNGYPAGLGVFDGAGTQLGQWNATGLTGDPLGVLRSPQPGVLPDSAETWHAASLGSGFAAPGGALAAPAYQGEGVNGGRVRLRGQVNLTGAQSAGAVVFTLAAHYVPAFDQQFSAPNTLSGASGQGASVGVDTSGNVVLLVPGSVGNTVRLDGWVFPLD